jgi:hypothetical protein
MKEHHDCQDKGHVFYKSRRFNLTGYPVCQICGLDDVNWGRLHKRNYADIEYTIEQLKREAVRVDWWIKEFDIKAKNQAIKKGYTELRKSAQKRLIASIGRVYQMVDGTRKPYRDGYQTPYTGNSIYFAQHALGCCCRKCVAVWHGIPNGRDLTEKEIEYFVELTMFYLKKKLPDLRV